MASGEWLWLLLVGWAQQQQLLQLPPHRRRVLRKHDQKGDDAEQRQLAQHLAEDHAADTVGEDLMLEPLHQVLDRDGEQDQHDDPAAEPRPVKVVALVAGRAGVQARVAREREEGVRLDRGGSGRRG